MQRCPRQQPRGRPCSLDREEQPRRSVPLADPRCRGGGRHFGIEAARRHDADHPITPPAIETQARGDSKNGGRAQGEGTDDDRGIRDHDGGHSLPPRPSAEQLILTLKRTMTCEEDRSPDHGDHEWHELEVRHLDDGDIPAVHARITGGFGHTVEGQGGEDNGKQDTGPGDGGVPGLAGESHEKRSICGARRSRTTAIAPHASPSVRPGIAAAIRLEGRSPRDAPT